MPELNGFSADDTIKALKRMGFNHQRTKGSHAVFRKDSHVCVVPLHSELAAGTLRGILRQAGVTLEDFISNI